SSNSITSQSFRQLFVPKFPAQPTIPSLTARQWRLFSIFPLTHLCRNIWYRSIHLKLPSRTGMHRFLPEIFPIDLCPVCQSHPDLLQHFLFTCPLKLEVWRLVCSHYFHSYLDLDSLSLSIQQAIYQLDSTSITPSVSPLDASVVIESTLHALWRSNWELVFDNRPYSPSVIVTTIHRLFSTASHGSYLHRGIPHCPPFFQL
ncbi:MAG: hypothetical protein EXX96DRAFT_627981, partial [Benjaminiella poitrasii]